MNKWEEIDNTPSSEEYEKKFAEKDVVTLEDLREMKEKGLSVESFLKFLGAKHGYLFHGSRRKLPREGELRQSWAGEIYASDNPAIAILKAIYSNKGVNLEYPFFIDEKNPLKLKINGANPETIGERGYVYVIPGKEEFQNDPPSSWQYLKKGSHKFIARIEIEKKDFTYPVEIKE